MFIELNVIPFPEFLYIRSSGEKGRMWKLWCWEITFEVRKAQNT